MRHVNEFRGHTEIHLNSDRLIMHWQAYALKLLLICFTQPKLNQFGFKKFEGVHRIVLVVVVFNIIMPITHHNSFIHDLLALLMEHILQIFEEIIHKNMIIHPFSDTLLSIVLGLIPDGVPKYFTFIDNFLESSLIPKGRHSPPQKNNKCLHITIHLSIRLISITVQAFAKASMVHY